MIKKVPNEHLPWGLTVLAWGSYLLWIIIERNHYESPITILSILPVLVTSWYFGLTGSALAIFGALTINTFILTFFYKYPLFSTFSDPALLVGYSVLILAAYLTGYLSSHVRRLRRRNDEHNKLNLDGRIYADILSQLNELSNVTFETKKISAILDCLTDKVCGLFGVDECSIVLWDIENNGTGSVIEAGVINNRLLRNHSQSNTIQHVDDKNISPGYQELSQRTSHGGQADGFPELKIEEGNISNSDGSEINIPIPVEDEVRGVLNIKSKRSNAFDRIDFDILLAVANLIGSALTRSKLYLSQEKKVDELAFLHAITLAITEVTSEDQLIERATKIITDNLNLDNFAFFLVDNDKNALNIHPSFLIYHDLVSENMTIPLGQGIIGHVVETGLPDRVADVTLSPHYLKVDSHTRSELAVPLKLGNDVIGVVNAESSKIDAFSEEDERLLITMAGQISTTIARLRAAEIERRNAEELAVLYDLSQQLIQQLDVDHVLEETYKGVTRLLDTSNFYIALLDSNRSQITFPINKFAQLNEDLNINVLDKGEGLTGHIIQSKAPILIKENPEAWQEENNVEIKGELPQSWLGVPLLIGKKAIGVMAIQDYEKPNIYDEHHLEIMTAIASQAAVAIENARLFEETEFHARELSVLNELAQKLTQQLDMDRILKETYNGVIRLIDTSDFYIGIHDSDKNIVTFPLFISSSEEDLKFLEISPDEGLTGHILNTKNPILINDNFKEWEEENAVETVGEVPRSWLGVPLLVGSKAIGVMAIQDFKSENVYDEHDLEMMTAIASQAAIAIQNARLFDKVNRLASVDELTGLYNRRHFLELAHVEFNRTLRYGRALSTIMLDIDNFKEFNDTFGHAIGDRVLQVVARLCTQTLRNTDILGRYGGEEFVVLLPETHLKVAGTVAERLRQRVSETTISTARGDLGVTISIGVAEFNELTPTLETLIARADQAMYISKHKGRNQVATSF